MKKVHSWTETEVPWIGELLEFQGASRADDSKFFDGWTDTASGAVLVQPGFCCYCGSSKEKGHSTYCNMNRMRGVLWKDPEDK